MPRDRTVRFRVSEQEYQTIRELGADFGANVSETLRRAAAEQLAARKQEDEEAAAIIREEIGERALEICRGLGVRPSGYLQEWRKSHPSAEERKAEREAALRKFEGWGEPFSTIAQRRREAEADDEDAGGDGD